MGIPWRLRQAFAVIAVVLSIAALAPREAAAASCAGSSHTMALSEGTVSPASGTTATTFMFTVVYTDSGGCAPAVIVVDIDGIGEFALTHVGGDPQAGATYGRAMTLAAGARRYGFSATSGSGPGLQSATLTNVEPLKVVVVAPTPRPTVRPTPVPTVVPVPTVIPSATATATPAPGASTTEPTESPGQWPSDSPSTPSPPAATTAWGAAGPVDSSWPGSGAGLPAGAASADDQAWDRNVPRPVLALLVSTIGTLFGLALFGVLANPLIGGRPRFEVGAAGRERRGANPSEPGSGR